MAIVLFAASAFFYSHPATSEEVTLSAGLGNYPYRAIALTFVGFGSALTLIASISYSKRSKHLGNDSRQL